MCAEICFQPLTASTTLEVKNDHACVIAQCIYNKFIEVIFCGRYGFTAKLFVATFDYSHLSNNRGGWNKREGGAKAAKSINVEVGIIVEVGIFLKNQ